MEKGLKKMDLSGAVSVSIQELPHLENLKEPLRVALNVSGVKADLDRRKVTIGKGEVRSRKERHFVVWLD